MRVLVGIVEDADDLDFEAADRMGDAAVKILRRDQLHGASRLGAGNLRSRAGGKRQRYGNSETAERLHGQDVIL